jgi:hypothetical protein
MEKIKNSFDEIVANYVSKKIEYWAVFDPRDGSIKGIYPNHGIIKDKNKIKIDHELAGQVIDGSVQISKCRVDIRKKTFSIVETKHLNSLDDVLHRIIEHRYFDNEDIDVKLVYDKKNKKITISMAYYLGGTCKTPRKRQKKKISWVGSTVLPFLITEYNDPNIILHSFEFTVNQLIGSNIVIEGIDLDIDNFSVYTKRVFDRYVIEKL